MLKHLRFRGIICYKKKIKHLSTEIICYKKKIEHLSTECTCRYLAWAEVRDPRAFST
jgi:hypothetical protein